MEEEIINKRKKIVAVVISLVGLITILLLAWNIRTANISNLKDITTGNSTLGPDLDPFLFLRNAKTIVETGSLPTTDYMRYVPLGFKTASETRLLPYMIAYTYKIFGFSSVTDAAVYFPVLMFLLTILAFFLFIRKAFESHKYATYIALVACLFLTLAPSLLARTVAGIPEKESAGFFFMFMAFYFFLVAWKSEKLSKNIFFGILAGLFTTFMGLIWGGWLYIFITIALFTAFSYFTEDITPKKILSYSSWYILAIVFQYILSSKYGLLDLLASSSSGLSLAVFSLIIVDLAIFKTRIKDIIPLQIIRLKVPDKLISIFIVIILAFVVSSIFFGFSFLPNMAKHTMHDLVNPISDRLSFTVAENRQPYFGEWKSEYGPDFRGMPLFFVIFFVGSILLCYRICESFDKKKKWIFTIAYTLFIIFLVFSRNSVGSLMDGKSGFSQFVFFSGFLIFGGTFLYFYYTLYKKNNLQELKSFNFSYIFILILFFVGLIGARSSIRLFMMLIPAASAISAFVLLDLVYKSFNTENQTWKYAFISITIILIFTATYTCYADYNNSIYSAKSMVPSIYTQQWQKAMAWVRTNTTKDAVFAHWWDYGYWLQSIGERATVTDGGNAYSYWNHLLGRHLLTAETEQEALDFLYTHNVTYFLVDSSDIGKYGAYSLIGGDENYDRYSQMSTFLQDPKSTQELKNSTVYVYGGGNFLDKDWQYKTNTTSIFFPSMKTGIGALLVEISNDGTPKQASVIFVYQNKQYTIPLKYVYLQKKLYTFDNGVYNGTIYLFTKVDPQEQGVSINNIGAALFISEKSMNYLWVKLYLLNQTQNFKLVEQQDSLIVEELKNQGYTDDLIYYGGLHGPIKIWQVNYTPETKFVDEYLSISYPSNLKEIKKNFI